MKMSYAAQAANMLGSLLLLVLILTHLDQGRYLQWIIFSTISGFAVQVENALSVVAARQLSRQYHGGRPGALAATIAALKRVYHGFGGITFLVLLVAGGAYLAVADGGQFSRLWPLEWAIMAAGFFVTFFPAHNCCQLIGLDHPSKYATIIFAVRVGNVLVSTALLLLGFAVLGLTLSFLVTSALGSLWFKLSTDRAVAETIATMPPPAGEPEPTRINLRQAAYQALFVFASYAIYRFGLLLDAAFTHDAVRQSSYGLALQMFLLITTLSIVPLTMRVAPLVGAVMTREPRRIVAELGTLGAYVNLMFVIGAVGLLVLGPVLLGLLPRRGATLPETIELATMAAAFLIEVNILIFCNALIAAQNFRFVSIYATSCAIAWTLGTIAWLAGAPFYVAFVILPVAVQALVTLPRIARLVRASTGVTAGDFLHAMGHRVALIARHPIKVGLAFRGPADL